MVHNKPYAELAKIYDRVMEHVKYEEWAKYISSVFGRFGIKVNTVLDIACGTGSLSIFLYRFGYEITGMDLSPSMLKSAADKFKKNNIPIKLFAADILSIPVKVQFDSVLCLYDSINYLIDPVDFRKAVEKVSTVTRTGGLFIFDVCTIKNSRSFFYNNSMCEDFGDIKYERQCRFYNAENIQENSFIIKYNGMQYEEKHLQRIYHIDEINEMISGLPFKKLGIFNDLTFYPGTENSDRITFVLKKI